MALSMISSCSFVTTVATNSFLFLEGNKHIFLARFITLRGVVNFIFLKKELIRICSKDCFNQLRRSCMLLPWVLIFIDGLLIMLNNVNCLQWYIHLYYENYQHIFFLFGVFINVICTIRSSRSAWPSRSDAKECQTAIIIICILTIVETRSTIIPYKENTLA